MKVFLSTIFFSLFALFQIGCSGNVSSNGGAANSANTNVIVTTASPETVNSPAPAATENKMPEVVPTFTDAGEALAAGNKYLDENKTENAISALQQATKLNPDLADAHFQLGIAYSLKEKEDATLQKVDETATPTPAPKKSSKGKKDEPQLLTNSDKAFDNAAKAYAKIVKKNPKDDAAFYNLGRAYNKINKDVESEKALRQAVKLKPEDMEYQTELGKILNKLARYDESVPILKKVVQADESNVQAVDALEKAEAGLKRTNFGVKPKVPSDLQKQMDERGRTRPGAPKPKDNDGTSGTTPSSKQPPSTTSTPKKEN